MFFQVTKPVLHGEAVGLSDEYAQIVYYYFHDLFSTMITLIGFMTLDSAQNVYFPLILERPELAVVFLSFILLVAVALMNLITAVIVENAFEASSEERHLLVKKEKKRMEELVQKLGYLFIELDESRDGSSRRALALAATTSGSKYCKHAHFGCECADS